MIQIGIASAAERIESLRETVNSLIKQTTLPSKISLYCQYGHPARQEDFPGVEIIHYKKEHGPYLGDAHKMWWASQTDGYYLVCDDDLIYPPDYIERMIAGVEQYGRNAIVGLHGVIMKPYPRKYYRDRIVLHGLHELKQDTPVHLVATCSAAWHTSKVKFSFDDCKKASMCDIWLGLYAQKNKIPCVALNRPADWVRHTDKIDLKETIFAKNSRLPKYVGDNYIFQVWNLY